MALNKVYPDAKAALAGVLRDGMTIMSGGFGLCGVPGVLIEAIRDSGVRNLTVISNNAGIDGVGLGLRLATDEEAVDAEPHVTGAAVDRRDVADVVDLLGDACGRVAVHEVPVGDPPAHATRVGGVAAHEV